MKLTWIALFAYATSVLAAPAIESGSLEGVELLPDVPQGQPAPDTAAVALSIPQFEVEEAILLTLLAQIKAEAALISL